MRDAGRIVKGLVRLYPEGYRDEYGDQIEQTAADMVAGAPNAVARWSIYIHLLVDVPMSAAVARLQYAGGFMQATPRYLKRSSLIAVALVLPFFAAIARRHCTVPQPGTISRTHGCGARRF